MDQEKLYAVIMAGGSGTRFWPASRKDRPKQFLSIIGERPMISETCKRLESLVPPERTLVVTSGNLAPQVHECLPDLPRENVLVEPTGRNTAPCVALAALEIARRDVDTLHLVLPADHVIAPVTSFRASLIAALAEARRDRRLVTLGVRPTFPATAYGYIEVGEGLAEHGSFSACRVERFVEKPDEEHAREFLASGRFLWNAGIFVWETATVIEALREHAPKILLPLEAADRSTDLEEIYATLPARPIDKAVMERATNRSVLPIEYSWNDVGSWTSLPEVIPSDPAGNCSGGGGKLVVADAKGNVVYGESGALTTLIGVSDLIVVRAGDAVLVCPKDRAQEVNDLVQRLEGEAPEAL